MTTKTKRILGAIGAVVVISGIVAANVIREKRSRVEVQMGTVEKRDLVEVVTASGEVRPRRYVNVGANVSGRIVDLLVQEGDRVTKGQVLARLHDARLEQAAAEAAAMVAAQEQMVARLEAGSRPEEIAQSRAEAAAASAEAESARATYERQRKMLEQHVTSPETAEVARAAARSATARTKAAQAALALLLAGPRQVGKTTAVRQVLDRLDVATHYATADEPTLQSAAWIAQQWETARILADRDRRRGAVFALDEIQKASAWAGTVKRLWDEDTAAGRRLKVEAGMQGGTQGLDTRFAGVDIQQVAQRLGKILGIGRIGLRCGHFASQLLPVFGKGVEYAVAPIAFGEDGQALLMVLQPGAFRHHARLVFGRQSELEKLRGQGIVAVRVVQDQGRDGDDVVLAQ